MFSGVILLVFTGDVPEACTEVFLAMQRDLEEEGKKGD